MVQRHRKANQRGQKDWRRPLDLRRNEKETVMNRSGISRTTSLQRSRDTHAMPKRGKNSMRQEMATELHDGLSQHLIGSLLSARVLVKLLEERNAPELEQARSLLTHLRSASDDVQAIIRKLDVGHSI